MTPNAPALAVDFALEDDTDVIAPSRAEWNRMRAVTKRCELERRARDRRRKFLVGALSGAFGTFAVATVFVVRALIAAGASSEASQAQAALVVDTAARVRAMENRMAALSAQLSVALARLSLHQPTE